MRILPWIYGQVGSVHAAASMRGFRRAPGFGSSVAPPPDPPPSIVAGASWGGVTSTPSDVGSGTGLGYLATPAARWTDVPKQTRTGTIRVGVVAFHCQGIAKVEIAADGGAWTEITTPSVNPDTGVYEYWATFDCSSVSDKEVEFRARVWPNTRGKVRVLQGAFQSSYTSEVVRTGMHSFYVWTNTSNTYDTVNYYVDSVSGNDTTGTGTIGNPYQTIEKVTKRLTEDGAELGGNNRDAYGATIWCAAGTYYPKWNHTDFPFVWVQSFDRWLTVRPKVGVSRASVIIDNTSAYESRVNLLRFKDVTVKGDGTNGIGATCANAADNVWFDGCDCYSPAGRGTYTAFGFVQIGRPWVTDCLWRDQRDGPKECKLCRGTTIERIAGDVFENGECLLNITCDDVEDTGAHGYHSDFFQIYRPGADESNLILYGARVSNADGAQGFFFKEAEVNSVKDSAFVNCTVSSASLYSQINVTCSHMMVMGCSMHHEISFAISATACDQNCTFVGNVFDGCQSDGTALAAVNAANWRSNHFVVGTTGGRIMPGTDTTSGAWSTIVDDEPAGDLTPKSGSALLNRVATPYLKVDAVNAVRGTTGTVGAYES
jgi:hypothetical protein